jgi:hypothetical protein
MGTSVGTLVFVKYGWRAGAGLSVAWTGWILLVLLVRGPHCQRYTWFGYEGGLESRKGFVEERERLKLQSDAQEKASSTDHEEKNGEGVKNLEGRV